MIILQLINKNKRICYTATQESGSISVKHESGGGFCYKPEQCFLMAACIWGDNPSCKVSGKYTEEFKDFCRTQTWFKKELL